MAVVRHRQAGGPTAAEFAEAIEVPPDATWLLLSGVGPRPLDPTAPVAGYGAQVIRFVPDGWLVEIDVMAARAG